MHASISIPSIFLTAFAFAPNAAAAEPQATTKWTIVAHLEGVDSERGGQLGCALYRSKEGWPSDRSKAQARVPSVGKGASRTCTFVVDRPGQYAIGAHHDEDRDQKLDKNFVGIPTEGWATSQNVTHTFSGPDFDESKFTVAGPKTVLRLEMHY